MTAAPAGQSDTSIVFGRVLEAKVARDYPTALAGITELLSQKPLVLCAPQIWDHLFNTPVWFTEAGEHDAYFEFAEAVMNRLDQACGRLDAKSGRALATAFVTAAQFRLTAHSDRNAKALMQGRAALFQRFLDPGISRGHDFRTTVSAAGRPRLGVIFKHLGQDPETTSVLPFFEQAKAAGIEVILFVTDPRGPKAFVEHIDTICQRVVQLPESLAVAVARLREADLDILLFGNDITAKPSMRAQLSFFRVARRTACCVSTLVTTASPVVDLYLGCSYYARRGAAAEFTERFLELPDPGFAFSFPERQPLPPAAFNRAKHGIAEDAILLTSGANHTKLHGGMIEVWLEILRRVPRAVLLLYPFPPHFGPAGAEMTARLRALFSAGGVDPDRLVILPPIPGRDAVIALLRHFDLGLDSFPYTGVTTIVDAVEARLPTVSLAGRTLRAAQGAAILHSIGLDALVTENRADYIELAVRLAQDSEARDSLRRELDAAMAATPPFLDAAAFGSAAASLYHRIYDEIAAGNTATEARA